MSIELENGNVVFKYDLGAGAAKISHPHYVSDNKWYKVTAKRSVGYTLYGPRRNKICLRGFRQSEIQTSLLSYRDKLEN